MIAFKNPQILYFLFTIAIPIIIHLFTFRKYKKVFFHSIYLLKDIDQEQNKTKNKLKEILILCTRILSIIAIVLAFAQPYIPNPHTQKLSPNEITAIYIDNSFSSQSKGKTGVLLDAMKKKAIEIINKMPETNKFYLFGNQPYDLENSILTKEQIKKIITSFTVSPHTRTISEIISKIQSLQIQEYNPVHLFILSDFQTYTSDIERINKDSKISISAIHFESNQINNISIDSCWFESPFRVTNQPEKLTVSITNHSNNTYSNIPIKLFINDELKGISTFTLLPNKSIKIPIEYSISNTGIISGKLSIEDFPILFDNSFYFSYSIQNQLPVCSINSKSDNKYIHALFAQSKQINYTTQNISNIDYSQLQNNSLIILHGLETIPSGLTQTLKTLVSSGKSIFIIPSETSNIENYNSFIQSFAPIKILPIETSTIKVSKVDFNHTLFANVFDKVNEANSFPTVYSHYPIVGTKLYSIISLQNKDALLSQIKYGDGSVFILASPLHPKSNTFASNPLFISLYNMALYVNSKLDIQSQIGKPCRIIKPKNLGENAIHVINKNKKIDIIPLFTSNNNNSTIIVNTMDEIKEAGNFYITIDNKVFSGLALNYNRKESEQKFETEETLSEKFIEANISNSAIFNSDSINISEQISENMLGTQLWRYFIILALLSLCCEVIIIRYYKNI